ncbi:calcium-dependent kinase [Raphidocelis subcapitata]|uniref:non-specific serine/threonine protein kinase n=1 Tax=Raphidocelis subcapitata TaxID=307507 RepID=A0A2V0PCU3_9CHLO|nr:calcium-dependent kinase [Raphidocelis subcapitata]|eukprot:GBF97666.1 calcium-dependent kinase [Raphidocelis subcapitata]
MGACSSKEEEPRRPVEARPHKHAAGGGEDAAQQQGDAAGGGGVQPDASSKSVLGRWQDVREYWIFDKVLGRGQFGVTRLVVNRASGERAACKSISKRKLVNPEDVEDVRREIKVMHHLSGHPHVVTFRGAYEDASHVHIVMELCTGGELFEHIAAKGHYNEKDAAHLTRSILMVVEHAHNMNVVHRDLKPENFLFREPGRRHIKAIDFGLSTFFQEGQVLRDLVGSPFYIYGKAADIWSCGVILYILLCGSPPFYGAGTQQIFRAVLHDALDTASPPWDTISAAAKDCVRRMLVRDPRRRATATEVLAHEWMRENGAASDSRELQPEILTRMRKFAGLNRLKKEALRVIATNLPPEEIEGIRRMFAEMDNDGSGTISFQELREGLRRKGAHIADSELQRLMASVDLDGNNTLDFQEFLTATVFLGKLERRELLLAAFQHFDSDGSGYITEAELREGLREHHMPEEQVQELLSEVDRDGNNRIDYDEFCRMLLPEMAGADHRRRSTQQQHSRESDGGSESPRHNVSTYYTARSGGWAASGAAHKVLPPAIEEE